MSLELLLPVESKNNEQPFRPLAGGVQKNLQSETIFSQRTEHHEEKLADRLLTVLCKLGDPQSSITLNVFSYYA